MDYREIISKKASVRDYKEKEVDKNILRELSAYARSCPRLVDDIAMDIRIMDNDLVYLQLDGYAGYNGILINAPHYIIILSEKKDHYIENAGYVGESISMKAYEMGLDTCWITFEDSETIIHKLNMVTGKEVVGILTLGYGKKKIAKTLGVLKTGDNYTQADMKKKKEGNTHFLPLDQMVYIDQWGNGADVNDLLDRALYDPMDCARKAPSTLNRQPWRFMLDNGKVILTVRDDPETSDYEEWIDAGIAMLYFEGVIEQVLCKVQWNLDPIENKYGIPEEYKIVGSCDV
ncbi:MAG: nitroreductase family protein [Clostridiales bacterium]|nr:nitroreductase family protein [Clostridiales bacterium]